MLGIGHGGMRMQQRLVPMQVAVFARWHRIVRAVVLQRLVHRGVLV